MGSGGGAKKQKATDVERAIAVARLDETNNGVELDCFTHDEC